MTDGVIDAHAHVWDPRLFRVPWAESTTLHAAMLPDALDDADGAVTGWVFVEADVDAAPVDEVAWVASLDWPGLLAIVADVDLRSPSLADDLRRLGDEPLVRGVRHLLQQLPEGSLGGSWLADGLREVASEGLVFEACVRWEQLPELAAALDRAPTIAVLDHLGKPPVDAGLRSSQGRGWLAGLRAVAEHPGARVKLSGLRAESRDGAALRRHAPAFLDAALEHFGAERCLFGSDWPVSTGRAAAFGAGEWIEIVRAAVGEAGWPAVARRTALAVYGAG